MRNVSSLSLAINYPTLASVPHSIINGFKNLLAIAVATDIDFAEAETVSLFYGGKVLRYFFVLMVRNYACAANGMEIYAVPCYQR